MLAVGKNIFVMLAALAGVVDSRMIHGHTRNVTVNQPTLARSNSEPIYNRFQTRNQGGEPFAPPTARQPISPAPKDRLSDWGKIICTVGGGFLGSTLFNQFYADSSIAGLPTFIMVGASGLISFGMFSHLETKKNDLDSDDPIKFDKMYNENSWTKSAASKMSFRGIGIGQYLSLGIAASTVYMLPSSGFM